MQSSATPRRPHTPSLASSERLLRLAAPTTVRARETVMNLVSRRLPTYASRCRPNLAAIKTSLQLLNQIGTPVPGLQAAVGTVLQIIEYAEVGGILGD